MLIGAHESPHANSRSPHRPCLFRQQTKHASRSATGKSDAAMSPLEKSNAFATRSLTITPKSSPSSVDGVGHDGALGRGGLAIHREP